MTKREVNAALALIHRVNQCLEQLATVTVVNEQLGTYGYKTILNFATSDIQEAIRLLTE